MNARIEKRIVDEKSFGLFVNDILIGTAKTQFDVDHAVVMLKKALGSGDRETWRIIYVPFVTITGCSESRTNHTFDTQEEAHSWIRRNPASSGLYRAEKD